MTDSQRIGWLRRLVRRQAQQATEDTGLACREVVELVTNYLEGALPESEHRRVEAHLSVCPHCTTYLQQFRQTIAATGKLTEQDLAPDAKEALVAAFRNWKAGQ